MVIKSGPHVAAEVKGFALVSYVGSTGPTGCVNMLDYNTDCEEPYMVLEHFGRNIGDLFNRNCKCQVSWVCVCICEKICVSLHFQ